MIWTLALTVPPKVIILDKHCSLGCDPRFKSNVFQICQESRDFALKEREVDLKNFSINFEQDTVQILNADWLEHLKDGLLGIARKAQRLMMPPELFRTLVWSAQADPPEGTLRQDRVFNYFHSALHRRSVLRIVQIMLPCSRTCSCSR